MRFIVKTLAALFILAMGVIAAGRTAAIYYTDIDPSKALEIYPDFAPALAAIAQQQYLANNNQVDKNIVAFAKRRMRAEPLSSTPLVYYAGYLRQNARVKEATAALELALQRNQQNALAQLLMTDLLLETGDLEGAIKHLSALILLTPQNTNDYVSVIAELAQVKKNRKHIIALLDSDIPWKGPLLRALNTKIADMRFLMELNRRRTADQTGFLKRLAQSENLDAALIAWLDYVDSQTAISWPYNRDFDTANEAPPPFNWRFGQNRVELVENEGLSASFLGRGSRQLAEQTMALNVGSYVFSAEMSGELQPGGGFFTWSLHCLPGNTEIARLDVKLLTNINSPQKVLFAVPSGDCRFQHLQLRGQPGEYPRRARAVTRSVLIVPELGG
jgi:hypothetical protein